MQNGCMLRGKKTKLIFEKKGFSLTADNKKDTGFYIFRAKRCSS